MIKKKLYYFILLSLALMPILTFAEDKLPEPMVGQTTVTQGEMTYYGAITGNETVLNYTDPGKEVGINLGPSAKNLSMGSGSNYIDFGRFDNPSLNDAFTISFWAKPDRSSVQNLLNFDNKLTISSGGITSGLPEITKIKCVGCEGANFEYSLRGTVVLGEWRFFVITYDGNLNRIVLHRSQLGDGSGDLQKRAYILSAFPEFDYTNLYIGKSNLGNQPIGVPMGDYTGHIDEVKIFDRALSDQELSLLYAGKPVVDNLVNYISFDSMTRVVRDEKSGMVGSLVGDSYEPSNDAPFIAPDRSGKALFGFDESNLIKCVNGIIEGETPNPCFRSNSNTSAVRVMTSRTYIGGLPGLEVATLLYGSAPMLIGDAYIGGRPLSDFNYWGRHLAEAENSVNSGESFWGLKEYELNDEAQSTLSGEEFEKFYDKIEQLKGEAKLADIPIIDDATIHLQGRSLNTVPEPSDLNSTPEGKVWKTGAGPMTTIKGFKYKGRGTIIVQGDLTIEGDIQQADQADQKSKIGFIVTGNVYIGSGCDIRAAIFTPGEFDVSGADNSTFVGSFVAKTFVGDQSASNLSFTYDYKLDSGWPPGFRYLNMPKPVN